MELQCSVTYKDLLYAYEQLKLNQRKDKCSVSSEAAKTLISQSSNDTVDNGRKKEPWQHSFHDSSPNKEGYRINSCDLGPRDSLKLIQNRMSSKSDNSVCYDMFGGRGYYTEMEGEHFELPSSSEELPCKPKLLHNVAIIEEEISVVQKKLVTQSLKAELHLIFPMIKVNPNCLDFGNVYIEEKAVRYCSLINLIGFPTDFKIKSRSKTSIFVISPLTGCLPSTNYNSDIGQTITIEFKPTQPGYFKETFQIYCNLDMEFDCYELFVCGIGTWNEKYKFPKVEYYTKLQGPYAYLQKLNLC